LAIIEKLKSLNDEDVTDSLIADLRDKSFIIDVEAIL
jgi:hypothetical protein